MTQLHQNSLVLVTCSTCKRSRSQHVKCNGSQWVIHQYFGTTGHSDHLAFFFLEKNYRKSLQPSIKRSHIQRSPSLVIIISYVCQDITSFLFAVINLSSFSLFVLIIILSRITAKQNQESSRTQDSLSRSFITGKEFWSKKELYWEKPKDFLPFSSVSDLWTLESKSTPDVGHIWYWRAFVVYPPVWINHRSSYRSWFISHDVIRSLFLDHINDCDISRWRKALWVIFEYKGTFEEKLLLRKEPLDFEGEGKPLSFVEESLSWFRWRWRLRFEDKRRTRTSSSCNHLPFAVTLQARESCLWLMCIDLVIRETHRASGGECLPSFYLNDERVIISTPNDYSCSLNTRCLWTEFTLTRKTIRMVFNIKTSFVWHLQSSCFSQIFQRACNNISESESVNVAFPFKDQITCWFSKCKNNCITFGNIRDDSSQIFAFKFSFLW